MQAWSGGAYIYIYGLHCIGQSIVFVSNTISFYSCTDKGGMYDKGVSPLSSTKTYLKKKVYFWTFLSLERVEFYFEHLHVSVCQGWNVWQVVIGGARTSGLTNVESVMGRRHWW